MKKILFAGYYGFKNMGDDVFGLVSALGAAKYWGVSASTLLSGQGPKSNAVQIAFAYPEKELFKGYSFIVGVLKVFLSDYVIYAGGSILHTKPKLLSINRFIFFLTKMNLLKVGAIGVSLGPFRTEVDYSYFQSTLKHFKFLALRDDASYEIACDMLLPYEPIQAADLALLLPEVIQDNHSDSNNSVGKLHVGVSLCHYERYWKLPQESEAHREEGIYRVLECLSRYDDIRFRFFVINGNENVGDLEVTKEMIESLSLDVGKYEIVPYCDDTSKMYNSIAECRVMISTRLHGAIFAAASNVPSLLVEYHTKCKDYLDDIELADKWRIGDMAVDPQEVAGLIVQLLYNEQPNYYPNRNGLVRRAKQNFLHHSIVEEICNG